MVVIGFDAMDAGLVRSMAADGRLPTFASLLDTWPSAPTVNPPGLLVGGVWPSFATGSLPDRHGFYCHRQIVGRTYDVRRFTPRDIAVDAVWKVLSDTGRRCAVIDAPITTPTSGLDGIQLTEWGAHDRMGPFASWPPTLATDVLDRFGPYPVDRCDHYSARGELAALRCDLLAGITTKTRLALHYLHAEPWDLFVVVHGASHCAGHQFWRVHDPSHPRHDSRERDALGDPLEDVYVALDESLAELLAALDGASRVIILLSHGVGPHYDGDHVLGEVLARLDDAYGRRPRALVARERAHRFLDRRRRTARGAVSVDGSRRFFKVPNNELYGGIRINIVGREPRGRVRSGTEYDTLVRTLRDDLLALTDPASGRPLVRDVLLTSDLYDGPARDALPDLLVDWYRDAPISGASSSRVGVVRADYDGVRTGDHRPPGLVLVRGSGVGPLPESVPVIDLAPTIAAWLGVGLPHADGRPIPALTGAPGQVP